MLHRNLGTLFGGVVSKGKMIFSKIETVSRRNSESSWLNGTPLLSSALWFWCSWLKYLEPAASLLKGRDAADISTSDMKYLENNQWISELQRALE